MQAVLGLDEEARGNAEWQLKTDEDLSLHLDHYERLLPRLRVPVQPHSCDDTSQGKISPIEALQYSATRCLNDARVCIKASAGLTSDTLRFCAYDPQRVEEATVTLNERDAHQLLQSVSEMGHHRSASESNAGQPLMISR